MSRYDTIIVGAGHNGLVCAAYLAKAGQRVLVLEAAKGLGGLAADREFHPGFRVSVAHSIGHFSRKVAEDLALTSHGLQYGNDAPELTGLGRGGNHVQVDGDKLDGGSREDTAAYRDYCRLMRRCADALKPFWLKTMPRIGATRLPELAAFAHIGLNLRRLGKQDMHEFMRIASLPVRDLMDEFFASDLVKATLGWDGLIGSKMAPRSPNGAVLAMLYRMSERPDGVHQASVGGLINALSASALAAGAELRCGVEVRNIVIEETADGPAARGVELAGGETLDADRVVSATDPKRTFLDLVGIRNLEIGFTNRIRRLRSDGYVGKLHLALGDLPAFEGLEQCDGRLIIAPDLDAIEFAYDDAKYGECSEDLVMEIVVPSLHDDSLSPKGMHVLSAHVMYVPYGLKGGWTDNARTTVRERAIDTIAKYAPRIREQIVHSEFLSPFDLEEQYRVSGGHWHHAEFVMDQMLMMRPTYEAAQYSTPVRGLYLCGAGSHPAGDLTGMAGHNAAREILR